VLDQIVLVGILLENLKN